MTDGVISLSSNNGYYATGDLLTELGIGTSSAGYTASIEQTGEITKGAVTETATLNSVISDYIKDWDNISHEVYITSSGGNIMKTVTISDTDTFDIFNGTGFSSSLYYYSASFTNGKLTVTGMPADTTTGIYQSRSMTYLTGDIMDALGVGVTTRGRNVTMTVGTTATGGLLTISTGGSAQGIADTSTKLTSLRPSDGSISQGNMLEAGDKLGIYYYINECMYYDTFTVSSTSTIGDFLSWVENKTGVNASMSGGKITITGDDSHYIGTTVSVVDAQGQSKDMVWKYFGFSVDSTHNSYLDFDTTKEVEGRMNSASTITLNTKFLKMTEDTTIGELMKANSVSLVNNMTTTVTATGSNASEFVYNSNTTVGEILDILQNSLGVEATLQDGRLTISDEGNALMNFALSNLLGIQTGEGLSYDSNAQTYVNTPSNQLVKGFSEIHTVSMDTTFAELGMTDSGTIEIYQTRYGYGGTITISSTNTVGDLRDALASFNIDLTISSNGYITISPRGTTYNDYYIKEASTNIRDALQVSMGQLSTYVYDNLYKNTDSNPLGGSASGYITEDTKLVDLGFSNTGERAMLIGEESSKGSQYNHFFRFTITDNSTVGELINAINDWSFPYSAELVNGKLTISVPVNYFVTEFDDEFADIFNLTAGEGYTYETTEIIGNTDSNRLTTGNAPVAATGSTTLGELGLVGLETFIKNKDNGAVYETMGVLATAGSTTLDELFRIIKDEYGIELSISNGVVTARNSGDYYMTGELAEALGIDVNVSHVVNTPKTVTSSSSITYLTTVTATGSSKIGDFIQLSSSTPSYNAITLHAADGYQYRFSVTNSTTFDDLLDAFAGAGISATMSGGVISFNNSISSGAYAEDAGAYGVLRKLGISTTAVSNVTETVAISQSSSSPVYVGSSELITEDSLISDAISLSSSNNKLVVESQSSVLGTITISSTMTFGDLKDKLSAYDIDMTVNSNGTLSLSRDSHNFVSGSFADAVGWDSDYTIEYTFLEMKSSSELTYTVTVSNAADLNTKLGDIIDMSSGSKEFVVYQPHNDTAGTPLWFDSDHTLNDIRQTLSLYGISMSVSNGVISLSSSENAYVTGELADALGIITHSYSASVGLSQTVDTSYLATATLDSKISDFIDNWDSIDHEIRVISAGGNVLHSVNIGKNVTFATVFNGNVFDYNSVNKIGFGYSISATMTNGVLTVTNTPSYSAGSSEANVYLEGDIIDALGIGVKTTSKTATQTVGATATGGQLINTINGSNADSGTKLTEFEVINNTSTMNRLAVGDKMTVSYYINEDYNSMTYTVTSTSTIGDFLSWLETTTGVDASISNGRITFTGDNSHYLAYISPVEAADGTEKESGYEYFGFDFSGENSYRNWYTTRTVTVKENTASSKITGYQPITTATTMGELGFGEGLTTMFSYVKGYGAGASVYEATVNVTHTMTVAEMFDTLKNQGAISSYALVDGRLTFTPAEDTVITSIYPGFSYCFNLKEGEDNAYDTRTFGTNSDSDKFTESHTDTYTASLTTTLGELGLTSNGVIRGSAPAGTAGDFRLTFSPDDTIASITSQLTEKGIFASLVDGKLIIRGTTSKVITSMDSNLENILKMEAGEGNSYKYQTIWINTTSDALNASSSGYMTEDTLFSELGFITNEATISTWIQTANDSFMFTVHQDTTVGEFVDELNSHGLSAYISNGKLTIAPTESNYLITLNNTNLESCLNFNSGKGYTYQVSNKTIYGNTTSQYISAQVTNTASGSTTLSQLGMSGNGTIKLQHSNGSQATITVSSSSTLQQLADQLNAYSSYNISLNIGSDGRVTISPNSTNYVTEISSNLESVLKLPGSGLNYTYTSTGATNYENTDSDKLGSITTHTATGTTTLSQLDGYSNGNGEILIKNGSNTIGTVTVSASDTIDSFLHKLADYGITASINSSGVLEMNADFQFSLESAAGGSNLPDLINFQSPTMSYSTVWSNKTTGSLGATSKVAATGGTKLENLEYADGTGISFDASGSASIILKTTANNGAVNNITLNFSKTQTLESVISTLAGYGLQASIDGTGRFNISSGTLADFDISGTLGSFLMGAYNKNYTVSNDLSSMEVATVTAGATRDTLLSDLGVTAGEYYIWNNGVKYTALISSDETLGSFLDTLASFGIQTGLITDGDSSKLVLIGQGNSYIAKSNSISNASNVVEKLFGNADPTVKYNYTGTQQISTTIVHKETATEDTLLSAFDTPWGNDFLKAEGSLALTVNGENKIINITSDETFGSLVDKLNAAGVNASFFNGKLYINDSNVTVNTAGTTSSIINPNSNIYLTFKDNLDGYLASDSAVIETTTIIEEKSGSAASWATLDTKMGDLNISEGTLSLYRDGEKAVFNIDPEKTFRDLKAEVAAKFADVDLDIENGVLVFKSKTDGVEIEVGATTDTSNFSAVTGLSKNEETGKVESARELYNVNVDSIVTNAGLFRRGQVTEGTFTVGNQEITIGATTTLADIISQINNSDEANATAYWDSIDGKLVIKSRTTGAALINIEAGTSNFTDIMGYTSTERNADGSVDVTRMNVETQKIGENARFSINGTTYTSSSNTVTSDISRIKGLTLELKDLTEGAPVTITVERDKETVANALSDVVDSYNELMKNLDESLAVDGSLHRETTLKLIRNQLRNLMTSSDMGATVFRNLDAIGISVDAASANNISTSNESIINLTFDKDKFLDAYEADADAVKALLVGGDTNKGVFTQVETLLENSLEAVSGYFAITEEGYQRQINRINEKIEKETLSIEKYRARLEKKFSAMDLLIAQMQQQYSSFLTT